MLESLACERLASRHSSTAASDPDGDADANRKRRRLHKARHLVLSLVPWRQRSGGGAGAGPGPGPGGGSPPHSPYRTLCLLTAGLAFALGLVVGVMIPLYVLPRGAAAKTPSSPPTWRQLNASWASARNASSPPAPPPPSPPSPAPALPLPPFPSVSFVAQASSSPSPTPSPRPPSSSPPAPSPAPLDAEAESQGGAVRGGVYWGRRVEAALPAGFSDAAADAWRRFTRHSPVVKVEEGCGRMQNRLLTFEDGTRACCRYRQNTDQIQGEVFSFYLGRLLGLRNLAPSALALVRPREALWSRVRPQLSLAQWAEERAVVLTRFVPALEPAHIPASLRTAARRLHPPDVAGRPASELAELAQWSDLIIFDYLTANLDRVVNNLYNLQWNPAMMDAPAHNLAREPGSGLLVFFDNESGLLHGYRLLDKYEHYHGALLQALCVFRRSTADAVRHLQAAGDVGARLQRLFAQADPELRDALPTLPERSVKILNERLAHVAERIQHCERQYAHAPAHAHAHAKT